MKQKSILMVLWMLTFCAACAQGESVEDARRAAAEAAATAQAVTLPDYPPECRQKFRSRVRLDDRQDTALLKTDNALARQHRRVDDCAAWYDQLQDGMAAPAAGAHNEGGLK